MKISHYLLVSLIFLCTLAHSIGAPNTASVQTTSSASSRTEPSLKKISTSKKDTSKLSHKTKSSSKTSEVIWKTQVTNDNPQTKNTFTLGGLPIIINPYLGEEPTYNGSQLLTNLAIQNTDLLTLQYRQELENAFLPSSLESKSPTNYFLIVSGSLNLQMDYIHPYIPPTESDINLYATNLTLLGGIGKWVTGFISYDFDSDAPSSLTPPQIGARTYNSRLYLTQGYLTIGNLASSDWYVSGGQMYVPFGKFNGFMINSPMTESLFIIEERPILLGYSHNKGTTELDAELYAYQGETITHVNSSVVNEWGITVDYLISHSHWNANIGAGYVSNITDSGSMLVNGNISENCELFAGFAYPCNTGFLLIHKVPGIGVHASFSINEYSFIGEYLTATRPYAIEDLEFNHQGASPSAFDMEASYALTLFRRPSSIAIGYSGTHEALALLLAAKEYSICFNTSIWRNTIESIGLQHDINYSPYDSTYGQGHERIYLPDDERNKGKTSNAIVFSITGAF